MHTLVVILTVRRSALPAFRKYEHLAARIMKVHGGRIERALVIDPDPHLATLRELHLVSFPDSAAFEAYRADLRLRDLASLRDRAVAATDVLVAEEGPTYDAT